MLAGDYVRRGTAEFVGTFALIFVGAGAVAFARTTTDMKWVLPSGAASGTHLGAPALGGISSGKGVTVEAVLTFFLVWVVFATVVDPRGSLKQVAGLAIGLTITFDALVGLGLTGGAMNPARAFGPQLVANHWSHFWVWYVGPIAGGAIAALIYEGLYLTPARSKPGDPMVVDEPASGTAAPD